MGKTKNLDQLLKELNEMQMQFDNLKDELIIDKTKNKKRQIKTELTSDKIDDDFFKTFSNAPSKVEDLSNISKNKVTNIDNKDDLFFSLDVDYNKVDKEGNIDKISEQIIEKETDKIINKPEQIIEKETDKIINKPKQIIKKETDKIINKPEQIIKKETDKIINKPEQIIEKKNIAISKDKSNLKKDVHEQTLKEKSYLSIKQKLDRIKKEISEREVEIKLEKNQIINKSKVINIDKDNVISKQVLHPIKKEKEKQIQTKSNEIPKSELKTNNSNAIDGKLNKNNTIDLLTIIILVLIIALIGTAWLILK